MNPVLAVPSFAGRLARGLVCLLLAGSVGLATAAKDTPLGSEIVPANYPTSSTEDIVRAIALTSLIGGHSSKIWPWADPLTREFLTPFTLLSRQFGMKSMVQMGTTFLGSPAPPAGYVPSFADPATRARFIDDVRMVAALNPDYFVLTTEVNLMHRFNPAEFEHFRTLYTEAYHAIKALSPTTQVGVSHLYSLWFANYHIDNVDVPSLLAPSDFIAFTTYPEWLVREGHFANIAAIPPDWYGASRLAYPNGKLVFSEVGWASAVRGTPQLQQEYIENLPRLFSTTQPEIVTWAVLHDASFYSRILLTPEALAFLISIGVDVDALFGHFNAMGLLDGVGNPKSAWWAAAQIDFTKP